MRSNAFLGVTGDTMIFKILLVGLESVAEKIVNMEVVQYS